MSDNVATLDQPAVQTDQQTQIDQVTQTTPDVSQIMADSLWNAQNTVYQNPEQQPAQEAAATTTTETQQQTDTTSQQAAQTAEEVLDEDEFMKRIFGMNVNEAKAKWEELNKPQQAQTAQEIKWSYDDSKEDELYNYIHQKKELARLEKYEVTDANQAGEILRANLQFKYKDTLSPQEIDRLYSKQYSLPAKPSQTLEQSDEDYAIAVSDWENQVKEKQMDMIIEAKMTKPELAKLKSQIVLPDIQKPQVQQEGPSQEELAAMEAGRKAYLDAVGSNYQNFKGFNITAKDGDVELPISYSINPDELSASKGQLENFNVNEFFEKRWFDQKGVPNITQMQEDLYLLTNRDKVFQTIANAASQKRYDHHVKIQNNINLKSVNQTMGPTSPSQNAPKNESQLVADRIWSM